MGCRGDLLMAAAKTVMLIGLGGVRYAVVMPRNKPTRKDIRPTGLSGQNLTNRIQSDQSSREQRITQAIRDLRQGKAQKRPLRSQKEHQNKKRLCREAGPDKTSSTHHQCAELRAQSSVRKREGCSRDRMKKQLRLTKKKSTKVPTRARTN